MDEILDGMTQIDCDILIIGGGTAGPMAVCFPISGGF